MSNDQRKSASIGKGLLASVLTFAAIGSAHAATQESSIFRYDGHDFTRVHTTLTTEEGTSAVGTKLDHNSPAYPLLVKKQSYTGPTTLFGHKCDSDYAPLVDANGQLTGAIFVALCDNNNGYANSGG